jgi:hypothetical protein
VGEFRVQMRELGVDRLLDLRVDGYLDPIVFRHFDGLSCPWQVDVEIVFGKERGDNFDAICSE